MSCINVPLVSTALVQRGTERPFLEFNIWQTSKETLNESNKMKWHSWQNHHLCWSPLLPPNHHHHHTCGLNCSRRYQCGNCSSTLPVGSQRHEGFVVSGFWHCLQMTQPFLHTADHCNDISLHSSPENRIMLRSATQYPATACGHEHISILSILIRFVERQQSDPHKNTGVGLQLCHM